MAASSAANTSADQKMTEKGVPLFHVILGVVIASLASHQLGSFLIRDGVVTPSIIPLTKDLYQMPTANWTIAKEEDRMDDDEEDEADEDDDEDVEVGMESKQLFADLEVVPQDLIASDDAVEDLMETVLDVCEASLVAHTCIEHDSARLIVCEGILEDRGHISIYAWPHQQAALLELQIVGNRLADRVEDILTPFRSSIRMQYDPKVIYSNPLEPSRWFMHTRGTERFLIDLEHDWTSSEDQKYRVASLKTGFQQVDVFDYESSHELVEMKIFQTEAPEYMEQHPEYFIPNRALFLDGIVQSTYAGNAGYHEALVQPSMFAHPKPTRVAIIGGGECATLREVLKHNTVEKAVMIEIDPGVIEASKQFLPQWNDCSMFRGSSRYCMDDKRVEIFNEDAFKWFMDRYLGADEEPTKFDVIIMDALDPQNVVEFAKALYGDGSFLKALYKALSDDGILVTQVGEAPDLLDPPEQHSDNRNRIIYANSLAKQGFQSVADYMEEHAGFESPWYFYAAFKDLSTRTNWMANEAEINLKIQKRSIETKDGNCPFDFFDGATMKMYQFPTRPSVVLFCRREPEPPGCDYDGHGFDPDLPDFNEEHFYVGTSKAGEHAGRGLFARSHIPEESYLMLKSSVDLITFEASTASLIDRISNHDIAELSGNEELTAFAWGYGYAPPGFGSGDTLQVDSGILTFVNHGCNGTSNIGCFPEITDNTVDPSHIPEEILMFRNQGLEYVFNPATARNTFQKAENVNMHKAIHTDEEILENYYEQFGGAKDWASHVKTLQKFCLGGIGEVGQYEQEVIEERGRLDEGSCSPDDASCQSATVEISPSGDVSMPSE